MHRSICLLLGLLSFSTGCSTAPPPDPVLSAKNQAKVAISYFDEGKALRELASKATGKEESDRLHARSDAEFTKSAAAFWMVFKIDQDDPFGHKCATLAGECYLRAREYELAVGCFKTILGTFNISSDVAVETLYWYADTRVKQGRLKEAHGLYKRISIQYPGTEWARAARQIAVIESEEDLEPVTNSVAEESDAEPFK